MNPTRNCTRILVPVCVSLDTKTTQKQKGENGSHRANAASWINGCNSSQIGKRRRIVVHNTNHEPGVLPDGEAASSPFSGYSSNIDLYIALGLRAHEFLTGFSTSGKGFFGGVV